MVRLIYTAPKWPHMPPQRTVVTDTASVQPRPMAKQVVTDFGLQSYTAKHAAD